MKKWSQLLASLIVFSFIASGCTIKRYTYPNEYYSLPVTEQKALCMEWWDILSSKSKKDITFYDPETWNPNSTTTNLTTSFAQLGNDIRVINIKRASDNIRRCTERHFSVDLPEGHSFHYMDKSNKPVFIRTDVDEMNISAARKTLGGSLNEALNLVSSAIEKQRNPYSYRIRTVIYALLEIQERDVSVKRNLLDKAIEDSTYLIDNFRPNRNDYFLRGYGLLLAGKHDRAKADFDTALEDLDSIDRKSLHFQPEARLYRAQQLCIAGRDSFRGSMDTRDGLTYISWFFKGFGEPRELSNYEQNLDDSLKKMQEICKNAKNLKNPTKDIKLRIAVERFTSYLDHTNFRGFDAAE